MDASQNSSMGATATSQSYTSPQSYSASSGSRTTQTDYSPTVIRRANRAVLCSPFFLKLLAEMRVSSVSVPTIAENSGAIKGYTRQPLSEVATESGLMWLVSVGILRREVDGQGQTDS
ncbi:MAG: Npun_F0494 family protein [Phormidesmis sp.]